MRKLKTSDVPVLCRCMKKLGLQEKCRAAALAANSVKDLWGNGFDLIWGLFDAATEPEGEGALYEFLSGPFEMTPAELADLDLDLLLDGLQQLAKENNLLAFFKSAARSMK